MRTRWWSRRAIGLHVALIVTVPACAFLCWWQATRAVAGNSLSWVYTFEWPFFAGYAVYMWWRLVHEDPEAAERRADIASAPMPSALAGGERSEEAVVAGGEGYDPYSEDDPELAAYNRYLTELNASGKQKRW